MGMGIHTDPEKRGGHCMACVRYILHRAWAHPEGLRIDDR